MESFREYLSESMWGKVKDAAKSAWKMANSPLFYKKQAQLEPSIDVSTQQQVYSAQHLKYIYDGIKRILTDAGLSANMDKPWENDPNFRKVSYENPTFVIRLISALEQASRIAGNLGFSQALDLLGKRRSEAIAIRDTLNKIFAARRQKEEETPKKKRAKPKFSGIKAQSIKSYLEDEVLRWNPDITRRKIVNLIAEKFKLTSQEASAYIKRILGGDNG